MELCEPLLVNAGQARPVDFACYHSALTPLNAFQFETFAGDGELRVPVKLLVQDFGQTGKIVPVSLFRLQLQNAAGLQVLATPFVLNSSQLSAVTGSNWILSDTVRIPLSGFGGKTVR